MKKILFPTLLLLCAFAHGQQNDYLVKQNGDSIFGNILFKDSRFLVENDAGITTEYPAADVWKVQSKNIKNNIVVPCNLHFYTDNIQELEVKRYRTSDRDTVLILDELYTTPRMNLYWGTDEYGAQYYFYKTATDPLPIQLFVKYYLSGDLGNSLSLMISQSSGAIHMETQKGYVNQLRQVMGDCKKITEGDWEALDYRGYSLKNIIKKFNKCK